ncbi:MAG: S8 family serine peptidase [Christensenellales bacterium]|jgi:subtilisin family serine protease|nr:S8 family serine peptidase [Eubacteriales bacterium]
MIEKKLDFDTYIKFVRGGERSALVYITSVKAFNYLKQDFKITHEFPFIRAVAVSGDFNEIRRLSTSPYVEYITSQSRVFALENDKKTEAGSDDGGGRLSKVLSEIDAPPSEGVPISERIEKLSLTTPLTGKGVTLAVLDTGIQPHLDISFPINRVKAFYDVYGGTEPYDDNGHGTFVAGIAAGSGIVSGKKLKGVAPDAELVGVKVIGSSGECGAFNVLEGMQWVLNNAKLLNIKVVCMSFGSSPLSSGDPLKLGAEVLVKNNMTVVCAAGNSGEDGLKSPAVSPDVISVGAVDGDLNEADFSSRGYFSGIRRPDIYAEGVAVTGLNYRGTYTVMSGTSVSAPYIAGAACLLYEKYRGLSPRDVKSMLIKSAEEYGGKRVIRFEK